MHASVKTPSLRHWLSHNLFHFAATTLALYVTVPTNAEGMLAAWGMNLDGQATTPLVLGPVRAIAGGSFHSVAVRADGSVAAWGKNDYGQCNVPAQLAGVIAVASAGEHTLALREDQTVVGWGRNDYHQATIPGDIVAVRSIAAGNAHSGVIRLNGTVRCWGYNSDGECNVPAGLGPVNMLSSGGYHNAALRENGSVVCWGYNGFGECNVPADLSPVVAVVSAGFHTAVLTNEGEVRCWGRNDFGQCNVPALAGPVESLAAGQLHTAVRLADGTVQAWGWNDYGQCTAPATLGPATVLACGQYHTLAIASQEHDPCTPHQDAVQWAVDQGGNGNYYARIAGPLPWDEAKVEAERLGGHLATITSAAENVFLTPLLTDGLYNVHHLGGWRVKGTWRWITGEPWSYTNWYPGEPNNATGSEFFLASWVQPGQWNDVQVTYVTAFVVEWEGPLDCDGNGACDGSEIANAPNLDINADGLLDACQCLGDVVDDGAVNGVDLARILNDWGTAGNGSDINDDGIVSGIDLAIVLDGWGACGD